MACRCEDIGKCKKDKGLLSIALGKATNILSIDDCIQEQLQSLMNNSPEAYTTDNIGEICTAIDKLNDDIRPATSELISEINAKQEELDAMIAAFEVEDAEFHASEGTAS